MNPERPDLTGNSLLSERQIVLPLTLAALLSFALYLTFTRFYRADLFGALADRYLGSGYCLLILFVFVAATLYALLQALGLVVERHHLCLLQGDTTAPPGYALACLLSGRRVSAEDGLLHTLKGWYGRAQSETALAQLSEHLAQWRGQQHQHNLAPLLFTVWVLPLLGFIGTVIGISQAIGGLETVIAAAGVPGSSGLAEVLSGLSFAFDTTFMGLILVIPTMLYTLPLRAKAEQLDLSYQALLLDRLLAAKPA